MVDVTVRMGLDLTHMLRCWGTPVLLAQRRFLGLGVCVFFTAPGAHTHLLLAIEGLCWAYDWLPGRLLRASCHCKGVGAALLA